MKNFLTIDSINLYSKYEYDSQKNVIDATLAFLSKEKGKRYEKEGKSFILTIFCIVAVKICLKDKNDFYNDNYTDYLLVVLYILNSSENGLDKVREAYNSSICSSVLSEYLNTCNSGSGAFTFPDEANNLIDYFNLNETKDYLEKEVYNEEVEEDNTEYSFRTNYVYAIIYFYILLCNAINDDEISYVNQRIKSVLYINIIYILFYYLYRNVEVECEENIQKYINQNSYTQLCDTICNELFVYDNGEYIPKYFSVCLPIRGDNLTNCNTFINIINSLLLPDDADEDDNYVYYSIFLWYVSEFRETDENIEVDIDNMIDELSDTCSGSSLLDFYINFLQNNEDSYITRNLITGREDDQFMEEINSIFESYMYSLLYIHKPEIIDNNFYELIHKLKLMKAYEMVPRLLKKYYIENINDAIYFYTYILSLYQKIQNIGMSSINNLEESEGLQIGDFFPSYKKSIYSEETNSGDLRIGHSNFTDIGDEGIKISRGILITDKEMRESGQDISEYIIKSEM
jgi:hypothetical protein